MTHSIFRREYQMKFQSITLDGSVLDVGGTKNASYQSLFKGSPSFTVMNISEQYGYDVKADAEDPFPFPDAYFDHVLLLNVLELLYDYESTLRECRRVLKPHGTLVCVNPFLVQVHHNPDDYFRFTDKALRRMFEEAGFSIGELLPMGVGAFAVAYHHTSWLLPGFLRRCVRFTCVGFDSLLSRCSKRYASLSRNYVLGYFLSASKNLQLLWVWLSTVLQEETELVVRECVCILG